MKKYLKYIILEELLSEMQLITEQESIAYINGVYLPEGVFKFNYEGTLFNLSTIPDNDIGDKVHELLKIATDDKWIIKTTDFKIINDSFKPISGEIKSRDTNKVHFNVKTEGGKTYLYSIKERLKKFAIWNDDNYSFEWLKAIDIDPNDQNIGKDAQEGTNTNYDTIIDNIWKLVMDEVWVWMKSSNIVESCREKHVSSWGNLGDSDPKTRGTCMSQILANRYKGANFSIPGDIVWPLVELIDAADKGKKFIDSKFSYLRKKNNYSISSVMTIFSILASSQYQINYPYGNILSNYKNFRDNITYLLTELRTGHAVKTNWNIKSADGKQLAHRPGKHYAEKSYFGSRFGLFKRDEEYIQRKGPSVGLGG